MLFRAGRFRWSRLPGVGLHESPLALLKEWGALHALMLAAVIVRVASGSLCITIRCRRDAPDGPSLMPKPSLAGARPELKRYAPLENSPEGCSVGVALRLSACADNAKERAVMCDLASLIVP